jgi:predicted nucleic acid-binding protein
MSRALLDTNVVLRLLAPNDPQHGRTVGAVEAALEQGVQLFVAPQVIMECWVVLTRPANVNGMDWDPEPAKEALRGVMDRFALLPETPAVFTAWWNAVGGGVKGKRAHDARLVAWMQVNDVDYVLTFNARDFQGFNGVNAVSPHERFPAP